jgi:hypothetical protein
LSWFESRPGSVFFFEFSMTLLTSITALALVGFLAGCGGPTAKLADDEEPPWTFQTPGQLRDRITNASMIVDFKIRDHAMARVALDACGSDYPAIAFDAISNITEFHVRDQAATDCARVLDDRGDRKSADKMAGQIADFAAADQLRSYLAQRPLRDQAAWNLGATTQN